jgi:predicted enzyme related to lactoylglutathione lyase
MSTTGTTTHVGHVVWHELLTTEVEKAKSFYTDLLGWEIEVWKPEELAYPMISVDGQTHGGFHTAPEGAPPHWLGHVYVADVDTSLAAATRLGATVLAGPLDMPEVGRFGVIADPQGAVISLYTPEGDGPSGQGVFAWDELLATDVEAAKSFYAEVVGWTTSEMHMETGAYTLFNAPDGSQVAGLMHKPDDVPSPPAWVVYLSTTDTDAAAERAHALGGTVAQEPFDVPDVGRIAIVVDSTGAAFGLFQAAGNPS